MTQSAFSVHFSELRNTVDAALAKEIARAAWPDSLKSAVEYSLMAGGKRLRPVLVLLANEVCGGEQQNAISAACAIEMIHTYSLIHDDLPSMDDDDFRRGRPTSHRVFGEAMAILAGDCLLTLAFETITSSPLEHRQVAELARILATAAGGAGMVGGQVLDLEAERGKFVKPENGPQKQEKKQNQSCDSAGNAVPAVADSVGSCSVHLAPNGRMPDSGENVSNRMAETRVEELCRIHRMKTGALIVGALELGAVCASADQNSRQQLRRYGDCIGLAFQIADDLLDVTGDQSQLGKQPGRDVDLGKLTFPSLLGIESSRSKAEELVQEACQAVSFFGDHSVWLKDLAKFIVERDH